MGDGPGTGGMRNGRDLVAPPVAGAGACGVDGVGQFGVCVHQQQRQQVVAAGDVAVYRRGHHAEVARDRAQADSPATPSADS